MEEKYTLKGIVLPFGIRSQRGHTYTQEAVQEAFEAFKAHLENGPIPGVLEQRSCVGSDNMTPLSEVSHVVTKVEMKESGIWAEMEVLDTPKGKIVKTLMEAGMLLWSASRAFGQVDDQGRAHLSEIVAFDLTGTPSFNNLEITPLIPHIPGGNRLEEEVTSEYVGRGIL